MSYVNCQLSGCCHTTCNLLLQDREMDGCGDGCWKNERYFTCERGHAIFTVLSKLRPDQRPRQGFSPGSSKLTVHSLVLCKRYDIKDLTVN